MLTDQQARSLNALLGPEQTVTDPDRLLTYAQDAGFQTGQPGGLALPANAEELQRLVEWAAGQRIPIIARGAGTGYAGGAVAPQGGVVLSLARINAILEVDVRGRLAVVEPGVVNETLQRQAQPHGLAYPPDPSSQAVCTLGGNIATNAGGPHCLKYGVTATYVLGLEVVLADGHRVQFGGPVLDAPEYDFAGLLTGSEGTLAIISQATLRLRRPHEGVKSLMVSYESAARAGEAVSAVIAAGLLPATIELMDGSMVAIVEEYLGAGLPRNAGATLILDVDGYRASLDPQLDEIAAILRRFGPLEVRLARTPQERETLWQARRSASGAVARISPYDYMLDVSVPRSRLAEALTEIAAIGERNGLRVTFLAHAGDGNLHPDLFYDPSRPGEMVRVHQAAADILALCAKLGGSISGEHGVGLEKRDHLPAMYMPDEIGAMLDVKDVFDPRGLLNPGKVFPPDFVRPSPSITPARLPAPTDAPLVPISPPEAADWLRALQAEAQPTYLAGGSTKWRGATLQGVTLSTRNLSGILALSADDLTITALAGTSLDMVQDAAAEAGFFVPLASPWPDATLGGIVATNLNTPLRALYGGIRDQLLAVQVALADGRLVRFGRPLAKDVAGYAMSKLFAGAYGTLGLVTEVTLRLMPRPRARSSLVVTVPDLQTGLDWASKALRHASLCSGLVLCPGPACGLSTSGHVLVFTAEGHPLDAVAEIDAVRRALVRLGTPVLAEADEIGATQQWCRALAGEGFLARVAVSPRDLPSCLARLAPGVLSGPLVVDVPHGIVTVVSPSSHVQAATDLLVSLRDALPAACSEEGGYAAAVALPRVWLPRIDTWGDQPDSASLMRRLKLTWDPADILNRGEFAAW